MKPCILLIEDDRDMRDLVSGHLEHSGFDVQRADDGIKGQALALQAAMSYDDEMLGASWDEEAWDDPGA